MCDVDKFLNHPSLIHEDPSMREIYAIKMAISEKLLAMTPEEEMEYYNKLNNEIVKKLGASQICISPD